MSQSNLHVPVSASWRVATGRMASPCVRHKYYSIEWLLFACTTHATRPNAVPAIVRVATDRMASLVAASVVCAQTMGWLRLVGFFNLQVSFAEYRLFNRAILQKRPVILRCLLIEATP